MKPELAFWIGGMIGIVLGVLSSERVTKRHTDDAWRDILVEHGVAEYYLDQSNQRQWHWKGEAK